MLLVRAPFKAQTRGLQLTDPRVADPNTFFGGNLGMLSVPRMARCTEDADPADRTMAIYLGRARKEQGQKTTSRVYDRMIGGLLNARLFV